MSRKLKDGDFTATHELKIYRDSEWQEFVAEVRNKESKVLVADYFTDDLDDAKHSGRDMLKRATACNATSKHW